ncbi:BQ2448_4144 [Microbotryum intermedium]|uniref:BQ2448_4144 protein n=1 Tax=Microbotryum intermedium TaxID=269621 RepID=A0A238FH96_9BASI|nr:BQ2448_4144 [Microbotryum intermedium]
MLLACSLIIAVLLGPLSEYVARRPIYLVSYGVFIAFNFQVAFADHDERRA